MARRHPLRFDAAEDATITRLFPDVAAITDLLPTRPADAIVRRARKIGVAQSFNTKSPDWSPRELRLLRVLYPNYNLLCALIPQRTRGAMKFRAKSLGLTRGRVANGYGTCAAWTAEEIVEAARYGGRPVGRSRGSLNSARRRLGIVVGAEAKQAALAEIKAAATARRKERRLAARSEQQAQRVRRAEIAAAERARRSEEAGRLIAEQGLRAAEARGISRRDRAAERRRRAAERQALERARVTERARHVEEEAARRAARAALFQSQPEISPRIIAAAARSPYGFDLIPTIRRAIPSDVWPQLRPAVVENAARAVLEQRCTLEDLPVRMPEMVRAVQALAFTAGGHA